MSFGGWEETEDLQETDSMLDSTQTATQDQGLNWNCDVSMIPTDQLDQPLSKHVK